MFVHPELLARSSCGVPGNNGYMVPEFRKVRKISPEVIYTKTAKITGVDEAPWKERRPHFTDEDRVDGEETVGGKESGGGRQVQTLSVWTKGSERPSLPQALAGMGVNVKQPTGWGGGSGETSRRGFYSEAEARSDWRRRKDGEGGGGGRRGSGLGAPRPSGRALPSPHLGPGDEYRPLTGHLREQRDLLMASVSLGQT